MNPEDVDTILPMLDEVIRSRFGSTLFPGGSPSNLAIVWKNELVKLDDAALATQAIAALYGEPQEGRPKPPTPADVRAMYRKLEKDRRMAVPALPETKYVRDIPQWVKTWVAARRHNDFRVLPEQKPGYDSLQTQEPGHRTYVWPDQVPMPPEQAAVYEAEGATLSAADVWRTLA